MIVDKPFELFGDLPIGTSVLEASAGTGKTFAITALAVRYIAQGHADISELLVITFTNAATSEVRERVRTRFVEVAAALEDPIAAKASADELIEFLARDNVETHRSNLARAVSDFDQATIVTTLSFCQRMLESLGIAGDRDPHSQFIEEPEGIWAETYADLFLNRFASDSDRPDWKKTVPVLRAATKDAQSPLVDAGPDDRLAGKLWRLAAAVRDEIDRRKRAVGVRDYSDLLVLLAETLRDPIAGPIACERIRARFKVALIDEFQDTDLLQWEIVERIFHQKVTLVLVGDPKQAIYGFRGADVNSYLKAKHQASNPFRLNRNWRSDARVLDALDYLWGGAALGDDEIVVTPIESQHGTRLATTHPIRLRYLTRLAAGNLVTYRGRDPLKTLPSVNAVRPLIARDVAADILRLLNSGTRYEERTVEPRDVAVLVRTNDQAESVRAALDALAIPSVLAGSTSVFATEAARDWLRVLNALASPHRAGVVRLAALTPLLGWSPEDLDAGADDGAASLGLEFRALADVAATTGFAAMFERLSTRFRLQERLLGQQSGERRLTDIRHLAESLNRVAVEESLGVVAMVRWLTDRVNDEKQGAKDKSRRLDSDAAAVQIATIHMSKGLEFPIVYVPFAWDHHVKSTPDTLSYHDNGSRMLDVGGPTGLGYAQRRKLAQAEEIGEQLRLFYVALTRAKCQLVLWWAPTVNTPESALQRMIFGRRQSPVGTPPKADVLADHEADAFFEQWSNASNGLIDVERVTGDPADMQRLARTTPAATGLAARNFTRTLDHSWRRTSYSALTADAHEAAYAASEPEDSVTDDEPVDVEPVISGPLPMNVFAGGTAFGTLVHEILEYADTGAPDLRAELRAQCREAVAQRITDIDGDALADALYAVMHTPLGFGTLASVLPKDRLAELDFEFPLAGGSIRDIAGLFRTYVDGPLATYWTQLTQVGSGPLRGFLTGSIDAVIRTPAAKFVVVDYKTNRIGTGELTIENYAPGPMAQAMMHSHYPLQAILYCVALHRYLRWRLPDYDPARHLGGVQYHFVRGMIGAQTPPGHGVFEWHPPVAMIAELSDLLGGQS